MTKRTRMLFFCITAIVALLALSVAPALAHHKDGHQDDPATTEEDTTEASSEETTEASRDDSSSDERSARTGGSRPSDPDPEPSEAPQSTSGPAECRSYSSIDNGPYDHDNCDNSQGMHGSGGNGKCAGCTGSSDDKSPGGQSKGDHNNGYECDNNGGVGKGNPAHNRCKPPTPPANVVELCPPGTTSAGLPVSEVTSCDDVLPNNVVRCPTGTDNAGQIMDDLEDCDVKGIKDRVLPRTIREAPDSVDDVAVLPFTGGGDMYLSVALGMLLLAAGAVALSLSRN